MIFSVIVPFLNEEKYIRTCIESLLNQDFDKGEYEIIFVDNGSNDNSLSIVRSYPCIICLQETKGNDFTARNAALAHARGHIIAFTDADCMVSPGWLNAIYNGMAKNNADMVMGHREFAPSSSILLKILGDYQNVKAAYFSRTKTAFIYANNMAIKKEVFDRSGTFKDWPVSPDTEFIQRYLKSTTTTNILYLPNMLIRHLEITHIFHWFQKQRRYGEYNRLVSFLGKIDSRHYKKTTFETCIRINNYSWPERIFLACLVFAEDRFYRFGSLMGRIKKGLGISTAQRV